MVPLEGLVVPNPSARYTSFVDHRVSEVPTIPEYGKNYIILLDPKERDNSGTYALLSELIKAHYTVVADISQTPPRFSDLADPML
jgi:hypothetical protein